MSNKRYQLLLNEEIVEKVKKQQEALTGSSNISALLNKILEEWSEGAESIVEHFQKKFREVNIKK